MLFKHSFLIPKTTIKKKPAEGKYNTLSAITKPTVNSKFEAGRNNNKPNRNPICSCLQRKKYVYKAIITVCVKYYTVIPTFDHGFLKTVFCIILL